jgi:hypothetical protein
MPYSLLENGKWNLKKQMPILIDIGDTNTFDYKPFKETLNRDDSGMTLDVVTVQ